MIIIHVSILPGTVRLVKAEFDYFLTNFTVST